MPAFARRLSLLAGGLVLAVTVPSFAAVSSPSKPRTTLVSGAPRLSADSAATQLALSAEGTAVAFATLAQNLGGPVPGPGLSAIYLRLLSTGSLQLISTATDDGRADGSSSEPALADGGGTVAWTSTATNLVAEDGNDASDVFVRRTRSQSALASVTPAGSPGNGPSSQPALSRDGRFVAFVSSATDLVAVDDNGVADVFVRDLVTGRTVLASRATDGRQGNGASSQPALDGRGTLVSFSSTADNLVAADTNRNGDVFVRTAGGRTQRVSVGPDDRQQNRSVSGPFPQISSVSSDGRWIAFDSDATNLVRRDANAHTDVFVHDRRAQTTVMASLSSGNVQGNSDSFFPRISPDGRYVAFASFASNLAPGDPAGQDVLLRDLRAQATSIASVTDKGGRRGAERVRQLLERPQASAYGEIVTFVSTAPNLGPGDTNGVADVFARRMAAPQTRPVRVLRGGARPVLSLSAVQSRATMFLCRWDDGAQLDCPRGRYEPRRPLAPGLHRLRVRAGGPGMKYDPRGRTLSLRVP